MNKKEKVLLGGTVALGLVFASGMILANQQSQVNQVAESTVEQTTISPEQMAKYEQAAKEIKENKPKTIVGEVFENGYLKKHGDHYHFVFGTPPSDAIYEQKKQISQNNHSDDDYVFNPKDIVSENELGFVVRHGDHYHFIYRSQLANAQTVTREDETGKKRTCKLLRIPHGDHFHDVLDCGDGSANYTFDDEPTSHHGGGTSGTVAAASTPSRQRQNSTSTSPTVQTSTTDMTTPGDKELTLQSPEIQKYLDYITYAYGVERDSIKFESVTNDQGEYIGKVFAFQNMEQGQDKNHIHPWVIPLKRFEVPNSDPSIPAEVRLSQEIDLIARRMGISRTAIRIVNGCFDIPHGDHSHSMNIVNKDGVEAYEKNKLPGIVPPFVAGDLNQEEVFQRIDEVKTRAQEKYKDDPVTLNRIIVALNEYKEQVQQKGNSTEGFVKGLENFEKKVVNKEQDVENSVTPQEQKMNATHEETIRKISELSLKDYGVTADELRDLATKARESGKEAQVNAIASLIQALRDANDRISIEGMRYLYFFTQHVLDQELPTALREEVASLINRYMGSRLNFGTTAVEALIIESYRAKLAIKEAHKNFNGKVEGAIGKNLKEIMTPASADELSILEEAKDFSEGTLDEADKDNSIPKSSILEQKEEEKSTEATTVSSSTSETTSTSTQESTEEKSTSAPETEASTSQEVTTEAVSETKSEPTQK